MLAGTASMLVGCASGSESGAGSVAAGKDDALKVDSDGKSGGTDSDVSEFYEHVISVSALAKTYAIGEKIVGVAIEYDVDVDASSVDPGHGGIGQQAQEKGLGSFSVLGRSIVTALSLIHI